MSSESNILADLAKGNEAAYRALYKDYYTMVKYFITTNNGSTEQANDVFQETIIVLFEKARDGKLELTASLKTIVYSISRNLWLKSLRDKKSTLSITDYEAFIGVEEEDDLEKELNAQTNIMYKCLDRVGEPCKTIITQFYYFKKSLKELAELLDYSNTDTVKTQKYKCLKRIRTMALENI